MGLFAIIGAATAVEYLKDLTQGSVTVKPLIGAGIVLLILSAVSEGISQKLALIMAWLLLLAVMFHGKDALASYLKNAGQS